MAEVTKQMATASSTIRTPGPESTGAAGLSSETKAGSLRRPMEEHRSWPMISRLPMTLSVRIPLSGFKVRDLLALACGQTIETTWAATEDVPLKVGELQIGWGEFEVLEQRMALRLARLA